MYRKRGKETEKLKSLGFNVAQEEINKKQRKKTKKVSCVKLALVMITKVLHTNITNIVQIVLQTTSTEEPVELVMTFNKTNTDDILPSADIEMEGILHNKLTVISSKQMPQVDETVNIDPLDSAIQKRG
jgi:hypothetical protein